MKENQITKEFNFCLKKDIFGLYEIAYNCLRDEKRTKLFKKAIHHVVKSGDVVLDIGTGTGILSLFAAKKKPKKIYAIELLSFLANTAAANFKRNNISDIVEILNIDGSYLGQIWDQISYHPDMIIMELMSTGLIEEMQIPVFNHLIEKRVVSQKTKIIPEMYSTFVELAEVNYEMYSFNLKMIQHEQQWQKSNIRNILTNRVLVNKIDFQSSIRISKKINSKVDEFLIFETKKNGTINGLVISGIAHLAPGIELGQSNLLNNPIVIPLEDITVKKGLEIKLKLNYSMAEGLNTIKAMVL